MKIGIHLHLNVPNNKMLKVGHVDILQVKTRFIVKILHKLNYVVDFELLYNLRN